MLNPSQKPMLSASIESPESITLPGLNAPFSEKESYVKATLAHKARRLASNKGRELSVEDAETVFNNTKRYFHQAHDYSYDLFVNLYHLQCWEQSHASADRDQPQATSVIQTLSRGLGLSASFAGLWYGWVGWDHGSAIGGDRLTEGAKISLGILASAISGTVNFLLYMLTMGTFGDRYLTLYREHGIYSKEAALLALSTVLGTAFAIPSALLMVSTGIDSHVPNWISYGMALIRGLLTTQSSIDSLLKLRSFLPRMLQDLLHPLRYYLPLKPFFSYEMGKKSIDFTGLTRAEIRMLARDNYNDSTRWLAALRDFFGVLASGYYSFTIAPDTALAVQEVLGVTLNPALINGLTCASFLALFLLNFRFISAGLRELQHLSAGQGREFLLDLTNLCLSAGSGISGAALAIAANRSLFATGFAYWAGSTMNAASDAAAMRKLSPRGQQPSFDVEGYAQLREWAVNLYSASPSDPEAPPQAAGEMDIISLMDERGLLAHTAPPAKPSCQLLLLCLISAAALGAGLVAALRFAPKELGRGVLEPIEHFGLGNNTAPNPQEEISLQQNLLSGLYTAGAAISILLALIELVRYAIPMACEQVIGCVQPARQPSPVLISYSALQQASRSSGMPSTADPADTRTPASGKPEREPAA